MTMDEKLCLMLYEAAANDLITESEKDEMIQYVKEGFSLTGPLGKYLDEIKRIKDESLDECTCPAFVKKFIDKNYDKIAAVSKIAEDEPNKIINANQIHAIVVVALEVIGILALIASIPLSTSAALVSAIGGYASIFIGWLVFIIGSIITGIRQDNYTKGYNDLMKIREALKKVNIRKLSDSDARKVTSMIDRIDRACMDNPYAAKLRT